MLRRGALVRLPKVGMPFRGDIHMPPRSRFVFVLLIVSTTAALCADPPKTRNVILVMTDGLRWQEVFRGPEEGLMTKEIGAVDDAEALKKQYPGDTPEARREALMPFLWTVIGRQGQVYGNRDKGSDAHVTNGKAFSYPGYSEAFCGFADDRIDSNKKIPNFNVTVFEWLHEMPAYKGRVAAFGAWDVFPFIFNTDRCGFMVDGGVEPVTRGIITERLELLNRLRQETPTRWGNEPFDSLTYHTALEWFKANRPRVVFLGLGETDEWGHEGRYADYLKAAHRVDGYLRELWETVEAMPEYRGTTSLIVTTDHGRGDVSTAPDDWRNHGAKHPGSENIWIAVMGPDTPALGERANVEAVTQSQVAATLAALLGEDYGKGEARAAKAIGEAVAGSGR